MSRATIKERVQNWLPESQFVRSVGVLAGGTAAGQAVIVLASPIITRLYTPDDFGVLAVFAAMFGIVVVIASLRYQLAIPLPEDRAQAANVLALSLCAVAGISVVSALVVWFIGDQITTWTNIPVLAPYLWLLPIGVLLAGAYQAFTYWAIRVKAYPRIARTKLQQGIGNVGTQVGLGLSQFGPVGLVIGQVVGKAAGLTYLVRMAWKDDGKLLSDVHWQEIRAMSYRYRQFPMYSTGAGLANKMGSDLPLVLFAALFSPATAGLYMLANRVVGAPLGLLKGAFGQVFFGNAAEANRLGKLEIITLNAIRSLLRVGTAPIIIFSIAAPGVFAVVFGSEWREAGVYVQFLAPMFFLQLCYSPLSTLSSVMRLERSSLIFQISLLSTRLVALLVGAGLNNIYIAIALFAVGSSIVYFLRMAWLFGKAGLRVGMWMKHVVSELTVVLPAGVGLILVERWLQAANISDLTVDITLVLTAIVICAAFIYWRALRFIADIDFRQTD